MNNAEQSVVRQCL